MNDSLKGKIKLISLNIEGNYHLNRVVSLIKAENPDVACLQEVYKKDVPYFKKTLGMWGKFAPLVSIRYKNSTYLPPKGLFGLLILSKHKPLEVDLKYYVGVRDKIPVYKSGDPNSFNRALLLIRFVKDEVKFSIITTHFTWSPKGTVIHLQRVNLNKMLRILDSIGEFVLCGDFNAPRGKEIYNKLAKLYTDNIPPEVTTTIDPNLHRAKKLQFVVDGMFSTPQFKLSKVQ